MAHSRSISRSNGAPARTVLLIFDRGPVAREGHALWSLFLQAGCHVRVGLTDAAAAWVAPGSFVKPACIPSEGAGHSRETTGPKSTVAFNDAAVDCASSPAIAPRAVDLVVILGASPQTLRRYLDGERTGQTQSWLNQRHRQRRLLLCPEALYSPALRAEMAARGWQIDAPADGTVPEGLYDRVFSDTIKGWCRAAQLHDVQVTLTHSYPEALREVAPTHAALRQAWLQELAANGFPTPREQHSHTFDAHFDRTAATADRSRQNDDLAATNTGTTQRQVRIETFGGPFLLPTKGRRAPQWSVDGPWPTDDALSYLRVQYIHPVTTEEAIAALVGRGTWAVRSDDHGDITVWHPVDGPRVLPNLPERTALARLVELLAATLAATPDP